MAKRLEKLSKLVILITAFIACFSYAQGDLSWEIEEYLEGYINACFNAQYQKSIDLAEDAIRAMEKEYGPEHLNVAAMLNNLAALYKIKGKYAEAHKLYSRALVIYEKRLGLDNYYAAKVWNAIGDNYQIRRKYPEAEKSYKNSQLILEKNFGSGNPNTSVLLSYLGSLYKDQRKYKEAEDMLLFSLRSITAAYGGGHPILIRPLNDIGKLCEMQGRLKEADEYYKYGWSIFKGNFYQEGASAGGALNRLQSEVDKLWEQRNEPIYKRLIDINDLYVGPWHPDAPEILDSLPNLYLELTRYSEAENIYEDALEIMLSNLGPEHLNIAKVLDNMARFYRKMRKFDKAQEASGKAKLIHGKNLYYGR